jgi:hypothetical protein
MLLAFAEFCELMAPPQRGQKRGPEGSALREERGLEFRLL